MSRYPNEVKPDKYRKSHVNVCHTIIYMHLSKKMILLFLLFNYQRVQLLLIATNFRNLKRISLIFIQFNLISH